MMRHQADMERRSATGLPGDEPTSERPFVGRQRELNELRAALERAWHRLGSLVLVTGEPGVGKTRLMEELAALAAAGGWMRFSGRCWEEGGAPAYWPWIQVVRAGGGKFEQLAPETPSGVDPQTVRFRLFDSVTEFLRQKAEERPLLVVLDDLHAADASSLLLLRFLVEGIAGSPILVVGSYREGEPRVPELADHFGELTRVGRRIALRGLAPPDIEEYVANVTRTRPLRPLAVRLHQITGGNPFFLGEVVRTLGSEGPIPALNPGARDPLLRPPEEVRTLIRRRVARLPKEAISALRVAAVVGREFELPILQRTSRLSPSRLMDALSETVVAGVVIGDGSAPRYAFVHELVRETLYDDLPATRRLELHMTIGRILEDLHRDDLEPHLSEIAHHFALAAPLGDVETAVAYLFRAGDRSAAVLAHEEAAIHYGRALELLGGIETSGERRCDLLLRLGDARWRAGDARGARSTFEEAIGAARRLGAVELLARAALGYVTALGGFLLFARFEAGATGADVLEEALSALPQGDSPLRARLLARLAVELYSANSPVERRVSLSGEAIEMARRLGDSEALVTALHARHWALATPEMVLERLAHTDEMLRVAEEVGNKELEFLAHNARFHCLLELCDGPGLDREIATMTELAQLIRQPSYVWHTDCLRTVRATLDGRVAEAERLAREALEIAGLRHSEYAGYVLQYAQMLAIRWAQGRTPEIWEIIDHHAERFPWIPRWRDALARAELGDVAAARAEVEQHAVRGFHDLPRDGLWLLHLCALAEACTLVGDERSGTELYELLLPFADRNAISFTLQPFGPVALRLGMLAAMLGRPDEAARHFVTAIERCERLGARAISARVLLEHARLLIALGDRDGADALLGQAQRICDDLHIPGILDRVLELRGPSDSRTAVFRREGEYWMISYADQMTRLRDSKGLRYVACLLGAPGREVHVLELVRAADGVSPRRQKVAAVSQAGLSVSGFEAAEGILDAEAKRAYQRRLRDLRVDLEQARDWNDPEKAARIAEEIDALTGELAGASGLGGRSRELPSPTERARVAVTKAIKNATRTIARECPPLGAHLAASLHTGRFCSYTPPAETPPPWAL